MAHVDLLIHADASSGDVYATLETTPGVPVDELRLALHAPDGARLVMSQHHARAIVAALTVALDKADQLTAEGDAA